MPHFRGEPLAVHPAFPPGGRASVIEKAEGPVPFDAPRIVYSDQDEHALEEFARVKGTLSCPPSISTFFVVYLVLGDSVLVLPLGEFLSPLRSTARR